MTINRPIPSSTTEQRRPTFPLEREAGSLFLGWGPKI
jgi:hypothetical protein